MLDVVSTGRAASYLGVKHEKPHKGRIYMPLCFYQLIR